MSEPRLSLVELEVLLQELGRQPLFEPATNREEDGSSRHLAKG